METSGAEITFNSADTLTDNRKEALMRDCRIEMNPFKFIALQKLKISQKINEHAKAEITMLIKDEWKEQYIEVLSEETWVSVTGVEEPAENENTASVVLFYGLVVNFCFSQNGYETILELELMSGSVKMDLNFHFRVFQNADTLCILLYEQITGTYPKGNVLCVEGDKDKTGGTLIQYQETDWEFLKRLAGRTGLYLVPDVLKKGIKYAVGLPDGTKRMVCFEKMEIMLDVSEYMEKLQNGIESLQPSEMIELKLTEREIFQLGDSVSYHGKNYYIYRIEREYIGNECSNAYFFKTADAIKVLPLQHRAVTGSSFDAVVTAVQKDKVQVKIKQDEWKAMDGEKWFLYTTVYSSPDGTGWYCMPEIGDSVRLYVPDKEENSFIISSVHKEAEGARQNPDYKSFKNKYGKEILFTPEGILMTNNQGMMVELNDREGITIASNKNITIQAKENLTIASGQASLLIAAEEKLQMKQGGNTAMTLSGDISFTGGEFRIQ